MQSFTHITRGLVYGLHDIVHISWAAELTAPEALGMCRLLENDVICPPDMLPFQFLHATSDVFRNQQPVFQENLPALSPDGSFLAVVDRHFMVRVIRCSTRSVVWQGRVMLPPTNAPPEDRTESVAQLAWVNGGGALMVMTVIDDVDPPLASRITVFDFVGA